MKTPWRAKPPHQNVWWKDKTTQKLFAQTGTHYQASSGKAVSSQPPRLVQDIFCTWHKEPFRSTEYTPGRAAETGWSFREEENQPLLQPTASQSPQGTQVSVTTAALGAAGCHHPSNLLSPRNPPCIPALHLNKEGPQCPMASLHSNTLSTTIFSKSSNKRSFPKVSVLWNSLEQSHFFLACYDAHLSSQTCHKLPWGWASSWCNSLTTGSAGTWMRSQNITDNIKMLFPSALHICLLSDEGRSCFILPLSSEII